MLVPGRVSIVVPTYNERENIPLLITGLKDVLGSQWDYEVIVVDDNSPDGTAGAVEEMAASEPRVKLMRRPGKLGLGSAVVEGVRASSGEYVVMMDADLSHRPQDLPGLLSAASDADIVVGSRYVPGGRVLNWPLSRRVFSRASCAFTCWMLGLRVRDATSGFVVFRRTALEPLLPRLRPRGFKLLMEILAKAPGARVREVPITFVDRTRGRSKFSGAEVMDSLRLCLQLRFNRKKAG